MKKYKTSFPMEFEKKTKKGITTIKKTVYFYAKSRRTHHDDFKAGYRTSKYSPLKTAGYRFGSPQQLTVGKGWDDMDYKILVTGFSKMIKDACTENYKLSSSPKKAIGKAKKLFCHIPLFILAKANDVELFPDIVARDAVTNMPIMPIYKTTYFERAAETLIDNARALLSEKYSARFSKKEDRGRFIDKNKNDKTKKSGSDTKKLSSIKEEKYSNEIEKVINELSSKIHLRLKAASDYVQKRTGFSVPPSATPFTPAADFSGKGAFYTPPSAAPLDLGGGTPPIPSGGGTPLSDDHSGGGAPLVPSGGGDDHSGGGAPLSDDHSSDGDPSSSGAIPLSADGSDPLGSNSSPLSRGSGNDISSYNKQDNKEPESTPPPTDNDAPDEEKDAEGYEDTGSLKLD